MLGRQGSSIPPNHRIDVDTFHSGNVGMPHHGSKKSKSFEGPPVKMTGIEIRPSARRQRRPSRLMQKARHA
jgi:hypothetical protein